MAVYCKVDHGRSRQRWTTMDNNGLQWATMGNNGQQRATMDNNPWWYMHLWCRFKTKFIHPVQRLFGIWNTWQEIRIPMVGQIFWTAVAQMPFPQPMGFVAELLKETRHQWEPSWQPHLSLENIFHWVNKQWTNIYRFQWVLWDELEACARSIASS